jgi:hypothetical protein
MSRVIVTEKTAFTYPELSEDAKERAQSAYNEFLWSDGEMHERMQDIADNVLAAHGFAPALNLEYSLYQPGGYPRFDTIGKRVFQDHTYDVRVENDSYRGMTVEVVSYDEHGCEEHLDYSGNEVEYTALKDELNKIQREIYRAFIAEDEYMLSDASLAETSEANEWEYDEDGNLA